MAELSQSNLHHSQSPAHPAAHDGNAPPHKAKGREAFKCRLQEYTQKLFLPLPMYETICEGCPQRLMFRSSVCVHGEIYTSPSSFSQRKAAEHDAAKVALGRLAEKFQHEYDCFPDCPEDAILCNFCKSIIYELSERMNMERPVYTTTRVVETGNDGFMSSLVINGETYTGVLAMSKKAAERSAAEVAIKALLGQPACRATIQQIADSKKRFRLKRKQADTAEGPNDALSRTNLKKQEIDLFCLVHDA